MLYRDFMEKFRPLYSSDEPAAPVAAAPAAEAAPVAPAAAAPAAEAAPAVVVEAPAAPAAEPTLLDAAKPEKPAAEPVKDAASDSPAPAEAAKVEGDKPEAKPDAKAEGDKKPDAEAKDAAKPDPGKPDATAKEPPAPIKYDAFKLPDGVKLDDERFSKFAEVAGLGQVPQDVAQSLLDLHIGEMTKYAEDVSKQADARQRDVWKKLNDTWKTDFRKDEQLGGNRSETTLAMAKAVIEEYGGSADQVKDLLAHTSNNGMGNYVGFIRLMANIGEALNIFEESEVQPNPTPPKIGGSRSERWYPNSKMNGASKA